MVINTWDTEMRARAYVGENALPCFTCVPSVPPFYASSVTCCKQTLRIQR